MTKRFKGIATAVAGGVLLAFGVRGAAAAAAAKAKASGIEVEGYPTAISAQHFTFTMERVTDVDVTQGPEPKPPFRIVTTSRTRFELANDAKVTRKEFFAALKSTDEVEVKGYIHGNKITAYKIEVED